MRSLCKIRAKEFPRKNCLCDSLSCDTSAKHVIMISEKDHETFDGGRFTNVNLLIPADFHTGILNIRCTHVCRIYLRNYSRSSESWTAGNWTHMHTVQWNLRITDTIETTKTVFHMELSFTQRLKYCYEMRASQCSFYREAPLFLKSKSIFYISQQSSNSSPVVHGKGMVWLMLWWWLSHVPNGSQIRKNCIEFIST